MPEFGKFEKAPYLVIDNAVQKYRIVLEGELRYDSCLRLDKHSLGKMIMDCLPPVPLEEEEHTFGKVRVTIEFMDRDVCQACGSVMRGEK